MKNSSVIYFCVLFIRVSGGYVNEIYILSTAQAASFWQSLTICETLVDCTLIYIPVKLLF